MYESKRSRTPAVSPDQRPGILHFGIAFETALDEIPACAAIEVIAPTIAPCTSLRAAWGTSAIAAPTPTDATKPPSAPSTVFFRRQPGQLMTAIAVPTSIAKISVKATGDRQAIHQRASCKARMAMK